MSLVARKSVGHFAASTMLGTFLVSAFAACKPRPTHTAERLAVAQALSQISTTCERCHVEIVAAWRTTDHALANRHVDARDRAAFTVAKFIEDGGSRFELDWRDGHPVMTEARTNAARVSHEPSLILGSKPLWQPLISAPGGRWQPADMAYDPAKHEWFNVFGQENRQHGEWGHWTGRGMNWNSMCAHCHMTGFRKNYDATADTYASSWIEHGVGCIQCHGPMPAGHLDPKYKSPPPKSTSPFLGDRARMMQTCAPCHARNELLTADFQPGDNYHDHYRLALPVDAATYYPDGQQRAEDFNWTSVALSRMGHAGVTCLDCHDPHTTKTILPATDNNLCLRCHGNPPPPTFPKAPTIDPVAHSHHKADSTGNQCATCHMPTTNYMVHAPRHDHGWTKPDPLLTKELGIPNACSSCHTDKSIEWTVGKTDEWYGAKLDSLQRTRARVVMAAQETNPNAADRLLALLKRDDIPAWRATYLSLLMPWSSRSDVQSAGRAALAAPDPLERAAAVRLLSETPLAADLLPAMLQDPVRLVRLDAEWALSPTLPAGSAARRELDAYLALFLDQPTGRLRLGQDLANRGHLPEAEREMATAATWDRNSPDIWDIHGQLLAMIGKPAEAAVSLDRAAVLAPHDGDVALRAGLAYAETGQLQEAENWFRQAIGREPRFDRAWYNLGLLLARLNRLTESEEALAKACEIVPRLPEYAYALSTVKLQRGNKIGAREAALRVLQFDPTHAGAMAVLRATN